MTVAVEDLKDSQEGETVVGTDRILSEDVLQDAEKEPRDVLVFVFAAVIELDCHSRHEGSTFV